MRAERGSGSVLTVAVIGALLCLAGVFTSLAAVLGAARQLSVAADQTALAAADVASGLLPGLPCEQAARVAAAHSGRLINCAIHESVATVEVGGSALGMALSARASAGPPGTNR